MSDFSSAMIKVAIGGLVAYVVSTLLITSFITGTSSADSMIRTILPLIIAVGVVMAVVMSSSRDGEIGNGSTGSDYYEDGDDDTEDSPEPIKYSENSIIPKTENNNKQEEHISTVIQPKSTNGRKYFGQKNKEG